MISTAQKYLLKKLGKVEFELSTASEGLANYHKLVGLFEGNSLEELRKSAADIKQLAIEMELFINSYYGKAE